MREAYRRRTEGYFGGSSASSFAFFPPSARLDWSGAGSPAEPALGGPWAFVPVAF